MNNYASNPLPGGQRNPSQGGLKGKLNTQVTVQLSLMRLLMIISIMILLVVWAFFIGVLMGRGETPENVVPEIARMMPSANSTVSESTALVAGMLEKGTGVEQSNSTPSRDVKDAQPEVVSNPKDGIIKPENLGLMDGMKNKPGRDDLTTEPLSTSIPPQKEKNKSKEKDVVVENKAKDKEQSTTLKNKAKDTKKDKNKDKNKDKTKDKEQNSVNSKGQFDYVYQVAASSDAAAAEKLKSKIASLGLSSNIQSGERDGKTVYRIQVNYRGTPDQIKNLRQELEKVGIKQIILRTKVPVQ